MSIVDLLSIGGGGFSPTVGKRRTNTFKQIQQIKGGSANQDSR